MNGNICIGLWIHRAIRAYFMLSAKRDARAAERFFRKALKASHNQTPRVINVDKNAAYPPAIDSLTEDQTLR